MAKTNRTRGVAFVEYGTDRQKFALPQAGHGGVGVCLFAKRLEEGEFRWPKIEDGVIRLTAAQFAALLEGPGLASSAPSAGDTSAA